MVNRIYLGADRVTISRPGYDAVSPPAVSYDYLSLDSRLNTVKPLMIAAVPGYVFGNKIFYGQTFSAAPVVDILFYNFFTASGETYAGVVRYEVFNDGNDYQRASYYIQHERDGFSLIDRAVSAHAPCFSGSWTLFYTAWKVQ